MTSPYTRCDACQRYLYMTAIAMAMMIAAIVTIILISPTLLSC
jgi:hypothetical protein